MRKDSLGLDGSTRKPTSITQSDFDSETADRKPIGYRTTPPTVPSSRGTDFQDDGTRPFAQLVQSCSHTDSHLSSRFLEAAVPEADSRERPSLSGSSLTSLDGRAASDSQDRSICEAPVFEAQPVQSNATTPIFDALLAAAQAQSAAGAAAEAAEAATSAAASAAAAAAAATSAAAAASDMAPVCAELAPVSVSAAAAAASAVMRSLPPPFDQAKAQALASAVGRAVATVVMQSAAAGGVVVDVEARGRVREREENKDDDGSE